MRSIRPKFPEIPVQNRMEKKVSENSIRKFRSTSRGCPFFWKFPVPFGISTWRKSAPVPLVVKATRWRRVFQVDTTLDAK